MWWFILTFILGLAVGRFRILPTAFLKRPQWFIWPSLAVLLLLLGYQVGHQPQVMNHLSEIGLQGVVIAVCAMAGSALCARLTYRFFFAESPRRATSDDSQDEEVSSR